MIPLRLKKVFLLVIAAVVIALAIFISFLTASARPLASAAFGDGRIIELEAITHGTNHVVGKEFPLPKPVRNWLPWRLREALYPKRPLQSVTLDQPGTIVWINAIDAKTKAHVSCNDLTIRVFSNGDTGATSVVRHTLQAPNFYRLGVKFPLIPVDKVRVELLSAQTNAGVTIDLAN